MALTAACGHSSAAVRASALTPPRKARVALAPDRPKSPPVSCTVTKAPPSLVIRAATARLARKASRLIATASSTVLTARRPPRKTTASALAGTDSTTLALTPCLAKLATTAVATPAPSSVTTMRCAPRMPGSAVPTGFAATSRREKRSTAACGAAATAAAITGLAGSPAARMWSIIWPRVRSVASSAGLTSGRFGARSRMAERISTRLILSIPRSASNSICTPSISCG